MERSRIRDRKEMKTKIRMLLEYGKERREVVGKNK